MDKYLDARSRFIIEKHTKDEWSFAKIGKELGITRQRVQQIFARDINKIREKFEKLEERYGTDDEYCQECGRKNERDVE